MTNGSKFHRITEELLAAHELFRRLGFLPTELGPLVTDRQILFQAARNGRVFRIDVAGGKAASGFTEQLAKLVTEEYAPAANWWNNCMTPESERVRIWLNSAALAASEEIVLALMRKGFKVREMIEAKGKN
jgi:hypothetical protein